jgi:hypothetical protein
LQILAQIQSENSIFNQEVTQIKYNHIPTQTLLEASEAKFVNLNIKTKGKNIGYVMGAGDEVGKISRKFKLQNYLFGSQRFREQFHPTI